MKAVFDPRGGYFRAGGVYMPSIIAELGVVIEDHLRNIGMIVGDELTPEQRKLIAEKRAAAESRTKAESASAPAASAEGFPPNASICGKCSTRAVVMMDGCATCLSCGHSKCG